MRPCCFCNTTITEASASREHVVPRWLQKHLDIENESVEPTLTALPDGTELKKRRHPVSQLKTGGICKACNNGWMSQLESEVQPVLLRFVEGSVETSRLIRAERRVLARWAAKTAYALDAGGLERRVPGEHLTVVRENDGRLPSGVAVFATTHEPTRKWYFAGGGTWRHAALSEEARQRVVDESYKIALQFGHAILVVAHWPLAGWNFRVEKEQLAKLWPATSQVAVYAHPSPMTSDTSEDLCLRHSMAITVSPTKKAVGRA